MRIVYDLDSLDPPLSRSVLTIGNFDGVHRAHQQILAQAGLFAANTGGPVVVLTFEPHPLTVVKPGQAPPRLSTVKEKLDLLERAGAEITVVAASTPALLHIEADRFVEEVLLQRFHPTHIVEGPSFGFGRGRRGTPDSLRSVAAGFGCEVHIVEPVTLQIDEGETLMVSSSLIRHLIADGKVRRAGLCLGRPYTLTGQVVEGDRRGRQFGFPTANLSVHEKLVPGDSVYVGRAEVGDRSYPAAISIGINPTFGGHERRIEAHLLDFDGDLYGRSLRLAFLRRLRRPTTFDSPDALIEQVHRDVETVRRASEESQRASQTGKAAAK